MTRNEEGLYKALEDELKRTGEPMTCAKLFDKTSIRKHAATINRVSDYLGNMWRKGEVLRLPAPRGMDGSRARWMYKWKGRPVTALPTEEQAIDYLDQHMILQRPSMEISESGGTVKIELPHLTITIVSRR